MPASYEHDYSPGMIIAAIEDELERAEIDGISRDVLPNAKEGQLTGYLAGLQKALQLASRA